MVDIEFNGFTTVLAVTDMQRSLDYYTKRLEFGLQWVWPDDGTDPDQIGLYLGQGGEGERIQLSLFKDSGNPKGWIFINVTNIDEIYQYYKSKDIEIEREIDDFPWGYREFWLRDPDGNQLRFTKELPNPNHTHE